MIFECRDLAFGWTPAAPLFSGISLTLHPGERVSVLGGNGAGKSTLGRALAGRVKGTGALLFDGIPLSDYSRADQAGLVQCVAQRPHLQISGRGQTVQEEIAFGPENLDLPTTEIVARVDMALELLGLSDLAQADCHRLSGGQTQRVVLAGALALQPALLILDEPMTDLDAETRERLMTHLRALPWQMAVLFLDIGYFDWMEGLIDQHMILSEGTLSAPYQASALLDQALPDAILLPESAEILRAARATGSYQGAIPLAAGLRAQRVAELAR